MPNRVLVTPTTFGRSDPALKQALLEAVPDAVFNQLGRPLKSAEVRALLPGCDGYIAGLDVIDRAALEGADRLKVIARYGVGVDNVDLEAASERGIIVTNTPDANAVSVAELAIGLLLALVRGIPQLDTDLRAGKWPRFHGLSLEGKTLGLVGFGAIGRQVARRLAGWDMTLLASDPVAQPAHGVELVVLERLLAEADFVSLHLPVLPSTRGMVNRQFLEQMKPGSCLINTARGELVQEDALADALTSGHLRGAALDAFHPEPPDPSSPLWYAPNLILTPHSGAHTDGAATRMGWGALQDCLAVLSGESPAHPVTFHPKEQPL